MDSEKNKKNRDNEKNKDNEKNNKNENSENADGNNGTYNNYNDYIKAMLGASGYYFDENNTLRRMDLDAERGCNDIPGGFQEIYPELYVIVGEILGSVLSGKMPINVQNSFGNWLELLGQIILTYNAQQQYYENGAGRYFRPENLNISNDFCKHEDDKEDDQGDTKIGKGKKEKRKSLEAEISNLKKQISSLEQEISNLKRN